MLVRQPIPDSTLVATEQPPTSPSPAANAIPPLVASGLVISKSDLVTALRLYLPDISDLAQIGPDSFIVIVSPPPVDAT